MKNKLFLGVLMAILALMPTYGVGSYGAGNVTEQVFAGAVPASASDFEYQLLDSLDGVVLLQYIGDGEEIILPSEIEGFPVLEIGSRAFSRTKVKTVVIPEIIDYMGREVFSYCTNLVSVKLSPSMDFIPGEAFLGCSKLQNVLIPESIENIVSRAFAGTGIQSISFPPNVLFVSYSNNKPIPSPEVFENCSKLESVKLPETMNIIPESFFSGCTSLKTVEMPPKLELIQGAAFYNCGSLKNIQLPETLVRIEDAFGKSGLVELNFPNSVKELECCLYSCSALEVVRLPDNLEKIPENMFVNESEGKSQIPLRSVNFPSALKEISYAAFYGLKTLTEVIIPENLTEIKFVGHLERDRSDPYGGLLMRTRAFLGTSLPLATQAKILKLGYFGSFK